MGQTKSTINLKFMDAVIDLLMALDIDAKDIAIITMCDT